MEEKLIEEELIIEEETQILDKNKMKKDIGRMGWGLIFYTIINFVIVLFDMVRQMIYIMMSTSDVALQDQRIAALSESAVSMIIGVSVGVLFLWLYMGNKVDTKEMFASKRPMDVRTFLKLLSVFMTAQLVVTILAQALESGLNAIGYSAMESIEAASGSSETITMFLYASFVAPIVEEVVYRGFVLEYLRKYGKIFAIVTSALLFGIMHGNLIQLVFAFFVGLVLAYVAVEYSIKWSILIHMINNFVFAELIGIAGKVFGETAELLLSNVTIYGFFVAGVIVLWRNKEKIREYVDENKDSKQKYRYAFTTAPLVLFTVVNLLLAVLAIQSLG